MQIQSMIKRIKKIGNRPQIWRCPRSPLSTWCAVKRIMLWDIAFQQHLQMKRFIRRKARNKEVEPYKQRYIHRRDTKRMSRLWGITKNIILQTLHIIHLKFLERLLIGKNRVLVAFQILLTIMAWKLLRVEIIIGIKIRLEELIKTKDNLALANSITISLKMP